MVVRLSDLENGTVPEKKGIVRLSDLIPPPQPSMKELVAEGKLPPFDARNSELSRQAEQFAQARQEPVSANPSAWNGILDNPIVHGAETAFDYAINKPLQSIGTIVADVAGAGNNLLTKPVTSFSGETLKPSQSRNILQDIADVWTKPEGGQVAHNAMVGAFPNDYSKMLPGTSLSLGDIEEGAAQFADIAPLIKGTKFVGGAIGKALTNFFNRSKAAPELEQATQELLALPAPKPLALREGTIPSGEPIPMPGRIAEPPAPLALPQGDYVAPIRLKPATPLQTLDTALQKIQPEVEQIVTAPRRRDLLIDYIQKHTQVPREEIHNMPITDLHDLGKLVEQDLRSNLYDVASRAAKKHGYDLPALLEGKTPSLKEMVARDAQRRVYGVYPESLPQVQTPKFNRQVTGQAAIAQRLGRGRNEPVRLSDIQEQVKPVEHYQNVVRPTAPTEAPRSPQNAPTISNERGFSRTVRTSPQTTEQLSGALTEKPNRYKQRNTKQLYNDAQQFIDKRGVEAATDYVMNARKVTDHHNAVAQLLAKKFQSEGNLERAIDVVSKTAQRGTELGRAIQALSLWNKLDTEGALLVGERQLNKGVTNPSEYRKLTADQARPIVASTERIADAQQTKSLAEEVMEIVANKTEGQSLTEAELAKIKEFQQQVGQINSKIKPFLPKDKAKQPDKTIRKISEIPPAERTRDNVVDFFKAQEEKAKERLRAKGYRVMSGIPIDDLTDWSIIGASKIAQGAVKFADFSEKMLSDFGQRIKPYLNQVYDKSVNTFRKANGLPTVEQLERITESAIKRGVLDESSAQSLRTLAKEISFMSDSFKLEATQDLQKSLQMLQKPTLLRKIATVQTIDQLLNAVTIARNVSGNELFNLTEKLTKLVALPIDYSLSKITGNERTIQLITHNQESYWENFLMGAKSGWKGVNPDGVMSQYDLHTPAFTSKWNPYTYFEKALGASLKGFDYAAYRRSVGESLGTWATVIAKNEKLSGKALTQRVQELIDNADENIMRMADEYGRYMTFQDSNFLSDAFVKGKRLLNFNKDFGIGDIVLKYPKTPANIIMRAIDYGPIGFTRGVVLLAKPFFRPGTFNQRQAVEALTRGIVGTFGTTALGYFLADVGILTGSASKDKDIRDLQSGAGQGPYRVNLSALKRWLASGLDPKAAELQQGDRLINYDWIQPIAVSVSMGANANQEVKKNKQTKTDKAGFGEIAYNAAMGGASTILEQPLIQGVKQFFDMQQNQTLGDKALETIKGVPSSFVPTLSNQIRKYNDNTTRSTYDPNAWKQMLNMAINRIPGLSRQLPDQYDALGRPKENYQDNSNTALNVFLNPAFTSKYKLSPEAKLVVDLINETGETKIAPRVPGKTITIKGIRDNLTPEEYSQIQRIAGEETVKGLQRNSTFLDSSVTDEAKIKKIIEVLNKAGDKARKEIQNQRLGR